MKYYLLVTVFVFNICFGQIIYKVTSLKTSYEYGETITINVLLHNQSNTTVNVPEGAYNLLFVELDSVKMASIVTEVNGQNYFNPGEKKEWTCYINPIATGLPRFGNVHTVRAYSGSFVDSVTIYAPKFRGGTASVSLDLNYSHDAVQKIKDSLKVSVVYSKTFSSFILEKWEIRDFDLDSLESVLKNDPRIRAFIVQRNFMFEQNFINDVNTVDKLPEIYALEQNYPNPFNPSTKIGYRIPEAGDVTLKVYDILGKEISTLVDEFQTAGKYSVEFHGSNLPGGIYICRLTSGNYTKSIKMMLIK